MTKISVLIENREKLSRKVNELMGNRNWLEWMLKAWEEHSKKPEFKDRGQMTELYFWGAIYFAAYSRRNTTETRAKKRWHMIALVRGKIKEKFGFDPGNEEDKAIWHVILNCIEDTKKALGYACGKDIYMSMGENQRKAITALVASHQEYSLEEQVEKSLAESEEISKNLEDAKEVGETLTRIFNNFGGKTREEIEEHTTLIKDKQGRIENLNRMINEATVNRVDETKETVRGKIAQAKEAGLTDKEILDSVSSIGDIKSIAELNMLVNIADNTRFLNKLVGMISNGIYQKERILRAEDRKLAEKEAKKNSILNGIERLKFDSGGLNADKYVESYITSIKSLFDAGDLKNANFALREAEQVVFRIGDGRNSILERAESALDFGASLEKSILAKRWSNLKKRLEKIQKDLGGELDLKTIEIAEKELALVLEEMYATKDALRNYASVSKNAKEIKIRDRRNLLFNAIKSPPKIQEKNSLDEIRAINLFLKKLNYLILHENLFSDEELASLLERIKNKKYEQLDRLIGKRIRETGAPPKEQELLDKIEELRQELDLSSSKIARQIETVRVLYQNLGKGMKKGRKNAERLSGGYMVSAPSQHCAKHVLLMLKDLGIEGPMGKTLRANAIKIDSKQEAKRLKTIMKLEEAHEAYESGEY